MQAGILVDPEVSKRKFHKEIGDLLKIPKLRQRGWIIESHDFPLVVVTFLTPSLQPTTAPFTARIDFTNYNLLPPSVQFLHPVTLETGVSVQGFQFINGVGTPVIVASHPDNKLNFLCLPGIQEFHCHPQHSGDTWDIHRYTGEGSLFFILNALWLNCIRPVTTFHFTLQLAVNNLSMGFEDKP